MKTILELLLYIALLVLKCNSFPLDTTDSGIFWQITDFHLDTNYSTHGIATEMCHQDPSGVVDDDSIGYYGNLLCDSPMTLVDSAIDAMAAIYPDPDFILWTGDSLAHQWNPEHTWDEVFAGLAKITSSLRARFPDVTILPVLGNHDATPNTQFNLTSQLFYHKYETTGHWQYILPEECRAAFDSGGSYVHKFSPKLKILVLNTNILSDRNKESLNGTVKDPWNILQFMQVELQKALDNKERVIIAAHFPPGFFERYTSEGFLSANYNKRYIDIVNSYSKVILAQVYGHLHTDTFRLHGLQEQVYSSAFMAPSVTPWSDRFANQPGRNPAIRIYSYNTTDNIITDYWQYYLDLDAANANTTLDYNINKTTATLSTSTEPTYTDTTYTDTDEPVTEPTHDTEEPPTDEPTTDEPTSGEPTTYEPTSGEPTNDKPTIEPTQDTEELPTGTTETTTTTGLPNTDVLPTVTTTTEKHSKKKELDTSDLAREEYNTDIGRRKRSTTYNLPMSVQVGEVVWKLEYQATKQYNVPDMSTGSLVKLYNTISTDQSMFDRYFYYNTVSSNNDTCTPRCRQVQLCTIAYSHIMLYNNCIAMSESQSIPTLHYHHEKVTASVDDSSTFYMSHMILIVLAVIGVIAVVLLVLWAYKTRIRKRSESYMNLPVLNHDFDYSALA